MLVFNASPLIVSAKAGMMDRFAGIWPDLVIPGAVANEVMDAGLERDAATDWISRPVNISRVVETNPPVPFLQAVTGTVGLILQAAKADPTFSIAEGIQAVRDAGLYLSDALVSKLLS